MTDNEELFKKYRPKSFSELLGQGDAISTLVDMGKRKEMPHAILMTGPSGCGKTTIARILRAKLKCSDWDYFETNGSSCRGIDDIRQIERQVGTSPLGGSCRIWYIDECHGLTNDAQEAFLKLLEDTPRHVYFFLATTNPGKLKKTIITRCTEIKCKPLAEGDLKELVLRVAKAEGKDLNADVAAKIAATSDGSARMALVKLHQVIGLPDADAQMAAVEKADTARQAIDIARALMNPKTKWPELKEILKAVDEEPETIRHMVLSYCTSVLLGNGNHARAALVIDEFRENWYDSKKAGLVVSCYNVVSG